MKPEHLIEREKLDNVSAGLGPKAGLLAWFRQRISFSGVRKVAVQEQEAPNQERLPTVEEVKNAILNDFSNYCQEYLKSLAKLDTDGIKEREITQAHDIVSADSNTPPSDATPSSREQHSETKRVSSEEFQELVLIFAKFVNSKLAWVDDEMTQRAILEQCKKFTDGIKAKFEALNDINDQAEFWRVLYTQISTEIMFDHRLFLASTIDDVVQYRYPAYFQKPGGSEGELFARIGGTVKEVKVPVIGDPLNGIENIEEDEHGNVTGVAVERRVLKLLKLDPNTQKKLISSIITSIKKYFSLAAAYPKEYTQFSLNSLGDLKARLGSEPKQIQSIVDEWLAERMAAFEKWRNRMTHTETFDQKLNRLAAEEAKMNDNVKKMQTDYALLKEAKDEILLTFRNIFTLRFPDRTEEILNLIAETIDFQWETIDPLVKKTFTRRWTRNGGYLITLFTTVSNDPHEALNGWLEMLEKERDNAVKKYFSAQKSKLASERRAAA